MCASAKPGFLKDEHVNLLSIRGQGVGERRKYTWPFLVGTNPRVSSFANIPVAPTLPQNNQEAPNFKRRLAGQSHF